jgi:hypothetical protein
MLNLFDIVAAISHRSLPTSPCELSERDVTSPSNLKVVGALSKEKILKTHYSRKSFFFRIIIAYRYQEIDRMPYFTPFITELLGSSKPPDVRAPRYAR